MNVPFDPRIESATISLEFVRDLKSVYTMDLLQSLRVVFDDIADEYKIPRMTDDEFAANIKRLEEQYEAYLQQEATAEKL